MFTASQTINSFHKNASVLAASKVSVHTSIWYIIISITNLRLCMPPVCTARKAWSYTTVWLSANVREDDISSKKHRRDIGGSSKIAVTIKESTSKVSEILTSTSTEIVLAVRESDRLFFHWICKFTGTRVRSNGVQLDV